MKFLIFLVILAGCANTQHKHPHDHGISSLRGSINRVNANWNNLLSVIQGLEVEITVVRGRLGHLEKRLEKVEAYEKRFTIIESDILEIVRLGETYEADFDKKITRLIKNIASLDEEHRAEMVGIRSSALNVLRVFREDMDEIRKSIKELEKEEKEVLEEDKEAEPAPDPSEIDPPAEKKD